MRYELHIPAVAPSPNSYVRAHWTKYHGIKKTWAWLVASAKSASPTPSQPLERARVTIVRYGDRLLDRDNLYGSVKPVVDALKVNRLIVDDSERHIELQVRQEERPKGAAPCTLVEIVALTA